jgi:hypothetical protein
VAGHVVGALVVVFKQRVAVGDEPREEALEVAVDLGVAFSVISSEALVWWMKRWHRPV